MFQNLSARLSKIVNTLSGRGRLTEENIKDSLRDVRLALLEADVALPVIKSFIASVRERAVGKDVIESLSPGQTFIKIVKDELIEVMGQTSEGLQLSAVPPVVIMVAGLQGSGKTTTVAKLAHYLKNKLQKKVSVASCDIYRAAAINQLQVLASQIDVDFFRSSQNQSPVEIAESALSNARKKYFDVLILDTAGRLHIDNDMMREIRDVHHKIEPHETLFVVDSMVGQDAVNAAAAFNENLPLSGIILTKTDGDARGGAALSVRHITGKPIKFLGVGEKTDKLEPFYPDRVASRILGMGDVLGLIEEVQSSVDENQAEKLVKKLKKGKKFDLEDLRTQLMMMNNMGGVSKILDKIPGLPNLDNIAQQQAGQKDETRRLLAIIDSMTMRERRSPDIINGSRKRRIAMGSGVQIQAVNRLLKQHRQMSKMMKKFSKGGVGKMLSSLQGMLPPN